MQKRPLTPQRCGRDAEVRESSLAACSMVCAVARIPVLERGERHRGLAGSPIELRSSVSTASCEVGTSNAGGKTGANCR